MNTKTHQQNIRFSSSDPAKENPLEPHHDTEIFTDVTYSSNVYNAMCELPFGTHNIQYLIKPENRNKFLHFLKAMMRSAVFQECEGFELDLNDSIYPTKITKRINTHFLINR